MTGLCILYSAFPAREAAVAAAKALLEQRLIACANIYDGVTSLYHWEGKLQQEPEVVLVAKTRKDMVDAAMAAIKKLHPYEIPCIIAYPVEHGFAPFVQWVINETTG